MLLFTAISTAQDVQINFTNPGNGVTICGDAETFTVNINNTGEDILAGGIFTLDLPDGIDYVTGTTGLLEDITNLNEPIFTLPEIGNAFEFTFQAQASCNAFNTINTSGNNVITNENSALFNYDTISSTNNEVMTNPSTVASYNIYFNNLHVNVTDAANIIDFSNLHTIEQQEIRVDITGNLNNFLTQFTVELDFSLAVGIELDGIDSIVINRPDGSTVTLTAAIIASVLNNDTLFFNAQTMLGISTFEAGTTIIVNNNFKADTNICGTEGAKKVYYKALMPCISSPTCFMNESNIPGEASDAKGVFSYTKELGALQVVGATDGNLSLCGDVALHTHTVTNTGSGPIYNVALYIETAQYLYATVTNLQINTIPTTYMINGIGGPWNTPSMLLNNNQYLEDLDGDGDFDDLQAGEQIIITYNISLNMPDSFFENTCTESGNIPYLGFKIYAQKSECDNSIGDPNFSFATIRNTRSGQPTLEINDDDFDEGDVEVVKFDFLSRGNSGGAGIPQGNVYSDDMFLSADIELPIGIVLDVNAPVVFVPTTGIAVPTSGNYSVTNIPTTDGSGVTTLHFKTDVPITFAMTSSAYYGGYFQFKLTTDCNAFLNQPVIPDVSLLKGEMSGEFTKCAGKEINLACAEKDIYLHCIPPDIDGEGGVDVCLIPLVAENFTAIRTTYGTLESTGAPILFPDVESDPNNNLGLNTNGAYACDGIRTEITGITCSPANQLYAYVWYDHPAGITTPFMMPDLNATVYSIDDGATFNPVTNMVLDTSTTTRTVYKIHVANAIAGNTRVIVRSYFNVSQSINNNPDFPDVFSFTEFRGGFNNIDSLPTNQLYHYGTDFEIYGLTYTSTERNSYGAVCGKSGFFRVYHSVTGGLGDDFPNEFREVLQLEDVRMNLTGVSSGNIVFGTGISGPGLAYTAGSGVYYPALELIPTGTPNEFRFIDATNNGVWRSLDKSMTTSYYRIQVYFDMTDCNQSGTEFLSGSITHTEQKYGNCTTTVHTEVISDPIVASSGSGFTQDDLVINALTSPLESINPITTFDFSIENTSSFGATYPWVKFTYPAGVSVSNNGFSGTVINTGNTSMLFIALNNIPIDTTIQGAIDVLFNSDCNDGQNINILAETGIACEEITADNINEISLCPLNTTPVVLIAKTSILQMDVLPLFDSNTPVQSCESFQYIVQIFNEGDANITNSEFSMTIPNGISVESVEYIYPVTQIANSPFDADAFLTNNSFLTTSNFNAGIDWPLQGITNSMLPGLLSNNGSQLNSYYQLLVTLQPNCEYDGRTPVQFVATGTPSCGEIQSVSADNIPTIVGLEQVVNYEPNITLEINQNDDCGNFTGTVTYISENTLGNNSEVVLTIGTTNTNIVLDPNPTVGFDIDETSTVAQTFSFNFTAAEDFCSDVTFNYSTNINTTLVCEGSEDCESSLQLVGDLISNVCCTIGNCEITPSMTILNGSEDDCGALACNMLVGINTSIVGNSDTTITEVVWNVYAITDLTNSVYSESGTLGHEFSDGTYSVCMTVFGLDTESNIVCEETICEEVTISCESCSIEYELSPIGEIEFDGPCNRYDVLINNYTATGAVISDYSWIVTDLITNTIIDTITDDSGAVPTFLDNYEFPSSGTYEVCLAVNANTTNGNNCTQNVCTTIEVICPNCSVKGLSFTSGENDANCRLYDFIANTSILGGTAQEFEWVISQNGNPILPPVVQLGAPSVFSHEFINDGVYEVTLIVRGVTPFGDVCESEISEIIEINCDTCVIESIDINAVSAVVYDGSCLEYTLNAVNSVISSGTIDTYSWVITDSSGGLVDTYSGNNVAITLPNTGAPFTVGLTVGGVHENGNDCIYQDSISITPDCADCSIVGSYSVIQNRQDPCNVRNFTPTFNIASGTVTSSQWIIYNTNNLSTPIDIDPMLQNTLSYTFPENGIYSVCLEVTGVNIMNETCNFRICEEVTITCEPCTIDAKFKKIKIDKCTYQFINLSSTGTWSNVQYFWDFGDGNTSTDFEPTHIYTADGVYTVTLTVTAENEVGETCSSTFESKRFKVKRCKPRRFGSEATNNVKIYPNPNKGVFTITLNDACKECSVQIFDVIGNKIDHEETQNGKDLLIDISGNATGVYFVSISNLGETSKHRIILE